MRVLSIPKLQDPYHTTFQLFRVQDTPGRNRTKYCSVYLTTGNVRQEEVDLTVLLITTIDNDQEENCGGPVTSQAQVKVKFKGKFGFVLYFRPSEILYIFLESN